MVTFIAQKPSFSSIMMYILGKKLCKIPRLILGKFRRGLGFGRERRPGRSLYVTYPFWSEAGYEDATGAAHAARRRVSNASRGQGPGVEREQGGVWSG